MAFETILLGLPSIVAAVHDDLASWLIALNDHRIEPANPQALC
jgi:hypothetical protein